MVNVDVRSEILRRVATGTPIVQLAREYKVSPQTISTWKGRAKKEAKKLARKGAVLPTVFVRQGAPEVRLVVNGVNVYCAVSDLKAVLEVLK